MTEQHDLQNLAEPDVRRLAEEIAFLLQARDVVTLSGDLGSGKTTFARALLRALSGDADLDVPSPTFTLVQLYDTPRFPVAHYDLYRLEDPEELDELGMDAALKHGVALVEWPERAHQPFAREQLDIRFSDGATADTRSLGIAASPALTERLTRFIAIRQFLHNHGWGTADTRFSFLQGDASPRRYARLLKADGGRAILMDSPRRPDGPAIRDGKPYSAIAHLAEDVRPFVAISEALRASGFSAPEVLGCDLDEGLVLIEDLGNRVFASEVARGTAHLPLWQSGTDTLARLRRHPPPAEMPLGDGSVYRLPQADEGVLHIETELLLDWYWPAMLGSSASAEDRDEFHNLWKSIFGKVLAGPKGWLLRDFHSPNLIALDDGHGKVGIIDFQDALFGPLAYDVVSLLQDARVDVPEAIETALLDRYISEVTAAESSFDETEFRFEYAALGAQRNTKILGIFARLAKRDGKRHYLAHIPRIWGYLERDLRHPGLSALAAWYDRHLPASQRANALNL